MNCIDCRYNLLKDGHSNCTYEEGECIKISVLEAENAELKKLLSEIYSELGFAELVRIRNNLPLEVQDAFMEYRSVV